MGGMYQSIHSQVTRPIASKEKENRSDGVITIGTTRKRNPTDLARAKLWGNKTGYMSSKSLGKCERRFQTFGYFKYSKLSAT
ncbi:conserved hypothetical protein [Coccidioides posadasii str. Silveira]|uniref:Uncharacterized protein n=1 Tax=Coccidioides posadasii (strain RMSCC 757 / Silveira) TaxID=443226 RepID=E9CUP9_COCPS|nr:conserved hypothetical protein [Coccidioides posadasii str. Silveira]